MVGLPFFKKKRDIHSFNHNSETYMVVIVSHLGSDIIKLDLALQIIRKLAEYFDEIKKFPWIINDIKQNLIDLDKIIQKNYKLRDSFYQMSNGIRGSLDYFYQQLRDYQYEINKTAQNIINKVESTMETSCIEYRVPNIELLSDHKENNKIFPILSNIIDVFGNMQVEIEKESDNMITILKDNDKIGFIKIQRKKVILCIDKLNVTLDLDIHNYSDSLQIIPAICKNI